MPLINQPLPEQSTFIQSFLTFTFSLANFGLHLSQHWSWEEVPTTFFLLVTYFSQTSSSIKTFGTKSFSNHETSKKCSTPFPKRTQGPFRSPVCRQSRRQSRSRVKAGKMCSSNLVRPTWRNSVWLSFGFLPFFFAWLFSFQAHDTTTMWDTYRDIEIEIHI